MRLEATELETSSAEDWRWEAVTRRDPALDGSFVYAVTSTRVYCRPSCPSRRPLRERVRFFASPDAAEAAGYRACRRCQPRSSQAPAVRRVQVARQYLDEHPDETVTLDRLGEIARMSRYHLQRTFKRVVGVSPKAYSNAQRLERMKQRLKKGDTVSRATYEAGYGSGSRVYEQARSELGMTPGNYRNGGRGMRVTYTVVPTSFGQLLVAGTERGLCAVMLGDEVSPLEASLHREFPAATIEQGNGELKDYTEALIERLEGQEKKSVPLDLRGSAFQRQVWDVLRRIPIGQTRSYQAIAQELGRPSAARAVARACANNPLAVVIPCHRVVRQDGELGGYRWGMERKKLLLERERSQRDSRKAPVVPAS
jgi:AraC family transcriptional regulator, regulatory protein of adaptative response / methylated-DNA-[protein]-cysteine methyltransferase